MKKGSEHMMFAHSPDGVPLSIVYDGLLYYYVTNLQGDVVAILDATGAEVVTYTYDAWGNILSIGGSKATTLGRDNPLRYRGYVYDQETGLYYLQSRYYDPEMGRFICADPVYISTGKGLVGNNMFAYCSNNPIQLVDHTGKFPVWAIFVMTAGAIVGAIIGFCAKGNLAKTALNQVAPKPVINPPTMPAVGSNTFDQLPEVSDDIGTMESNVETGELTMGERVTNAAIGAGIGLGVASAGVAVVGAVGAVAMGSVTASIGWLGGSGAQIFSLGAAIYNIVVPTIGAFFGVEVEPIEYTP